MTDSLRPKIGLLALTLELYETLVPGLRESRESWLQQSVIPGLQASCDVLFNAAVFRRETIEKAMAQFEAVGADAVLVVYLTYAPSQLALPALCRTRLPIAIWNTQQLERVNEAFSVASMIDNHGVHGTQDLASVLTRAEVPFHYVTSLPDDSAGLTDLTDFFAAACAASRLRRARLGLLGYPFPGMGDFAVDTTHMAATLGCSWLHLSVEEYVDRSAAAADDDVQDLVADYRDQYEVASDVTSVDLESTARAELAVRGMVHDNALDALTYQFLAFGEDQRVSTLPFVAASRLMADGIGFGGEGDLIAAAGTAFLNWLQPPATFSEMFTIDFAGQSLFMSHMGEANVNMARRDRRVPLVARPTPITRTRDRQLALVTCLEPGEATFAALTLGPQSWWRWIVSQVTIENFGPLPNFCVPHFKMRPSTSVAEFLTRYARAGGPHHNAVCWGDARRKLRMAADLCGAEYCEV